MLLAAAATPVKEAAIALSGKVGKRGFDRSAQHSSPLARTLPPGPVVLKVDVAASGAGSPLYPFAVAHGSSSSSSSTWHLDERDEATRYTRRKRVTRVKDCQDGAVQQRAEGGPGLAGKQQPRNLCARSLQDLITYPSASPDRASRTYTPTLRRLSLQGQSGSGGGSRRVGPTAYQHRRRDESESAGEQQQRWRWQQQQQQQRESI